ncbi:MAG: hypothetical protein IT459_01635 [Planctomycetes bacterium]|nr:hypothetical protein [Planctomycetota bacterium]
MANRKPPLSGRDLIRYLPDLLTGKEPVFDDPAVQRFITQDPEGRAAVGLIADTAAALTVAHDRIATQTYTAIKPLRDSVLAAKKYAKRQLADLLFYEGWRRLQDGLNAMGVLAFSDVKEPPSPAATNQDHVDALLNEIALPFDTRSSIRELLCTRTASTASRSAAESAYQIFSADAALVPGREGTSVMREIAAECAGSARSALYWERLSTTFDAPLARVAAIDRAAMRRCSNGQFDKCAPLLDEIVQLAPSTFGYQAHALLIGITVDDDRRVRACAERVVQYAVYSNVPLQKSIQGLCEDLATLTRALTDQEKSRCRHRIAALDPALLPLGKGLET